MTLDILVLADLHYPQPPTEEKPCHGDRARLFYQKALRKLRHENITPGLVILLGDLVHESNTPGSDAEYHLSMLAEETARDGIPVLAVPGNHDNPGLVEKLFESTPGLHIVNGCGFLLFRDTRVPGRKKFTRPEDGLALPARIAREHPGLPLIALQHAALAREAPEKYRLENADGAMDSFAAAGVKLSLSGHAHETHAPVQHGSVSCLTLPAFCEAPFTFLHVRVDGADIAATFHSLKLPDIPALADTHCHTAFAQCGAGATAVTTRRVADILGLRTLAITEHIFQLYFARPAAWSFQWVDDPALAEAVWQTPERGRMAAYKKFILSQRRGNLLIGLELDLFDNGRLLLHPDDFQGWDILLGAMHRIQGAVRGMLPAQIETLYMRDLQALCNHRVHILAHPLRIFKSYNVPPPVHLYNDIARMLARAGVAAEINFHNTPPDPLLCAACLRHGAKLSLGTDTHAPASIADLHPHLKLLGELGVTPEDYPKILFNPVL